MSTKTKVPIKRVPGYTPINGANLLALLEEMKGKTTLPGIDVKHNPSLYMIDNLIWFMSQMEVPWHLKLMFWTDKPQTNYKSWINIHEDHWIVNRNTMNKLLQLKQI